MRYLNKKPDDIKQPEPAEIIDQSLPFKLQDYRDQLTILLEGCSDAVIRQFHFGYQDRTPALLVYFDGLVDRQEIENNLLKPLMLELEMARQSSTLEGNNILEQVKENILTMADILLLNTYDEVCHHISSGDTVLFIDGYNQALAVSTRSWQGRSIETPENEVVVFGPKEGFTETLRFNTALIRRRIKSTNLKIEHFVVGRISKTDVVLCYINGIVPVNLVNEVRSRLSKIDIDAVLDPQYLEEFIADHKSTIFTQAEHTEKPDRVCAHLLEGRIGIMVDGSPMALILPISFPQYWIAAEDYYTHFVPASLFRILRFTAFLLALTLPSLYVAVISYHQEMVPTALYLTIAATRQGVPFPAFVEALLLEATFELLREAGLRLPRAVGPAVSIVGALIIGDAAVRAGLVSTPMVVIIAFTGIASFVSPAYNAGIIVRIARFAFLISSAVLGFLGIMIMLILMLIRMASLSSLGLPYLAPVAPLNRAQLSDIIIRRPWFKSEKRPYLEGMENQIRQKPSDGQEERP